MEKKLLQIFAVLAAMLFLAAPLCARPWGIVATSPEDNGTDNASIHTIDLGQDPPLVYGPFLATKLSNNASTSVLDVTLVPGNFKALISTFENKKVYVVSLLDPANPVLQQSFTLPFPAEDITISRNGKLALVTDGGGSSKVAFIDLQKVTVTTFDLGAGRSAQAAAVARNNVALFADYSNGAIHYGRINKTRDGLESIKTIALCDDGSYDNATDCSGSIGRPVNITISPNGRTALVATGPGNAMYVLELKNKGDVRPGNPFILTNLPGPQQSIAFENDKTAHAVIQPAASVPDGPNNLLCAISITGPGQAVYVGDCIVLLNSPQFQYFGVDTVDIAKKKALVGNAYNNNLGTPDTNPYYNYVSYIDLKTGELTPIELNNEGFASGVAIKP